MCRRNQVLSDWNILISAGQCEACTDLQASVHRQRQRLEQASPSPCRSQKVLSSEKILGISTPTRAVTMATSIKDEDECGHTHTLVYSIQLNCRAKGHWAVSELLPVYYKLQQIDFPPFSESLNLQSSNIRGTKISQKSEEQNPECLCVVHEVMFQLHFSPCSQWEWVGMI